MILFMGLACSVRAVDPLPISMKDATEKDKLRYMDEQAEKSYAQKMAVGRARHEARAKVPADEPAFVFTHILAPHPPFVFDATGGPRRSEIPFMFADGSHWLDQHGWAAGHYPEKYRGQAMYVMAQIGTAIDRILEQATRPTVIIVQGDHGPGSRLDWEKPGRSDHRERFGIFNGWYLSPGLEVSLAEGASAINTFPVLFEGVFGATVPRQPDLFIVSKWSAPYVFKTIKN